MSGARWARWTAGLALCTAIGLPIPSVADKSHTNDAVSGADFEGRQVHKLGTLNADYLCEKLFDSADPIGMFTELVTIVGPRLAVSKLTGSEPKVDKEMYATLRIMARQKIWLPAAAEKQVGQWMDDRLVKEGRIIDGSKLAKNQRKRYEAVKRLFDAAVKTLPADNPYQFKLSIYQDNESNAFMKPGGFAYVTQGMLQDKTLDDNAIALRLSHEIAHLTKRHTLKEFQVKIIDALEISQTLTPLLNFASNPGKSMDLIFGTKEATELMFQRFDEVQELEADACGTHLLTMEENINAKKAVADFTEARKDTSSPKSWDNAHPAPAERTLVMTAQVDPATYGRLSQRRASPGNAPAAVATAPVIQKADKTGTRPTRGTQTAATSTLPQDLNTLDATSAGNAQPTTTRDAPAPKETWLDKLKRSLPSGPAASGNEAPKSPQER